ncbi:hypothetical protein PV04_01874 [Phialophora macrospora]|uniref:Major facilitator superfamily (MFS) profile domain-containing protein n=1 Tax=Phialophora macrospora TaxID=1851006 RepID=A0A0D2EHC4_9EURO|nr:hypothetical protein PV04_01874 [Phialophora macrospora]
MASKAETDTVEHAAPAATDEIDAKPHTRDADDALWFATESEGITWTEAEEKKVLWKIDGVILSLLFFGSIVSYADTQAYGFAAIFGLVQDLKLFVVKIVGGTPAIETSKYQLSAGISTLGAVAGQYPLLLLAQHLPVGRFYGAVIIYIGITAILVIVCNDFADITALRFFSGFAVVAQPLSIIITSMWWKNKEQPLRAGIYISGTAIGSLAGQGVDFGAVRIQGAYATSPWKWIYVILGSVTIGYGVLATLVFPATPMKAWFLTAREKEIAVRRLAQNNTGIQTRKFKWKQVKEAFTDPQLYIFGIYSFTFAFVNNAIGSFGGFLVSSFGYSNSRALVLSMPASAMAIACMVSSGVLGTIFPRRRILIAILYLLPSMAGNILLWKSDRSSKGALLAGVYISTTLYGALVQEFALLSSNIAGHTKKTVTNATIFVLANLGGFCGPWAYKGNEAAEGYPTGQITTLSLLSASVGVFVLLWLYYLRCNKSKAPLREEHPELITDPSIAFADLTDRVNPVFQYVC